MAKRDKSLWRCPACSTEKRAVGNRRPYCDCNPRAPYPMEYVLALEIVDRILGKKR